MNNEKTKFVRQVAEVDIDIISVCGSIPIEIPILWPRAVMVGPRPRVVMVGPRARVVMVGPRPRVLLTAHLFTNISASLKLQFGGPLVGNPCCTD
jgi:hypothetical protein